MKALIVSTVPQIKDVIGKYLEQGLFKNFEFKYLIEYFDDPLPTEKREDEWSCKDFSDVKEVDRLIIEIVSENFDTIITDDEYAIYVAAQIRSKLDLSGPRPEEAIIYRDKVEMKAALENSKVRIPKVYRIEDIKKGEYELPLLSKPRAFGGANGVTIFRDEDHLKSFLDKNARMFRSDSKFKELDENDLQMEEFIEGDLYHIDGLVRNGVIQFVSVGKYIGSCVDFQQKDLPLGSCMVDDDQEIMAWKEFASEVMLSLKIPDGAFHLEAFENTRKEKIFLEIAARPGGASVMPGIQTSFNIDLRLEHFLLQLGQDFRKEIVKTNNSGWLVFPKRFRQTDEKIIKKAQLPEMDKYQSIKKAIIPKVGDLACGGFSYMNNNGDFLFEHKDTAVIRSEIHEVIKNYVVEIES